METPEQDVLKVPEEAVVTASPPRSLAVVAAVGAIGVVALISSYFLLFPRTDTAPSTPVATSSPVVTPDSQAYLEARTNVPIITSGARPGSASSTDEVLFRPAPPVAPSPTATITFTPIDQQESVTTAETDQSILAEIERAGNPEPAFNRANGNPEAEVDAADDSVQVVAPITVTNTTQTGNIVTRSVEGLVRDVDADKGVILVGYIGEAGTLVTVTPQTTYRIDGKQTTFGALTSSDIVRIEGSGYETSATMEADTVTIIGTYERSADEPSV